ncbi:MAG: hypothetical protein MHM6MM_008252, partial [Cercozoa sp. M6MM]
MGVRHVQGQTAFNEALKNAGKKPVIVDFSAAWCGPCKSIAPTFEQLSNEFSSVVCLKVDVDESKGVAQACGVAAMPTFLVFSQASRQSDLELRGADPRALRALFEKASKLNNVFSGQGFSLTGSSSATATSVTATQSTAKPKRFNPWADPNFVPPGMRPKPQPAAAPVENATVPAASGSSDDVTKQLIDMGFSVPHIERAKQTLGVNELESLLAWLCENPLDSGSAAAATVAAAPAEPAAPSLPPKPKRGDPLGHKPGVVYEDEDTPATPGLLRKLESKQAQKTQSSNTAAAAPAKPKAPRTREEQKSKLADMRAKRKERLAVQ